MDKVEYMLEAYRSWPSQVESGYASGLEASGRLQGPIRGVHFCGMGTSGFAGEYAGLILSGTRLLEGPYWVHRCPEPPAWLSRDDLVVAVSYSGTTAETLSCARKSLERGARLVAVTSGGRLAKTADLVARLTPGRPQRTSLAEMTSAILGLLAGERASGIVESIRNAVGLPEPRIVGEIAREVAKGGILVVSGCGYLGYAAHRWRTEAAENAKIVAKAESYPESGHNDLVAYQEKQAAPLVFVVLEDKSDRFCSNIMEAVVEIYDKHGPVYRIEPEGETWPARLLRASQLAGITTVRIAAERGIDPESTPILHGYRDSVRSILRG